LIEAADNHFFAVSEVFEIETGSIGTEDNLSRESALLAYPNPAASGESIRLVGEENSAASWTLSDILGRPLAQGEWRNSEPRALMLPSRFAGQAILNIESETGVRRVKILVLPN